jgi:putative transposase
MPLACSKIAPGTGERTLRQERILPSPQSSFASAWKETMKQRETPKRNRERTPNNRTMTGFRISDELWTVLQPLLPAPVDIHRLSGGRPRVPDRSCADSIFYVLRTGCHWKVLAQTDLCAPSTAHDRFQEWMRAGVFLKLWQAGPEQFEELQGIDWSWYASKRARTKLPWRRRNTSKNPTSRGKGGRKRRRISSEHEMPVALVTEEARRHGMKRVQSTPDAIVMELAFPICTEQQPRMNQGLSEDSDEKQGLLHAWGVPAKQSLRTRPWEVSDGLWKRVEPLIPERVSHAKGGRPPEDDRKMFTAIVYVLRTGIQWNALPRERGASTTVYSRFRLWEKQGLFMQLWQNGLQEYDELVGLDWEWQSLDGVMTKAPLGGGATGPNPTDRAKSGTKRSQLCEGHGLPLAVTVDGANVHDTRLVASTLDAIVIARPEPSEKAPQHLCLDAAYLGRRTQEVIDQHQYIAHIRPIDEDRAQARSSDPTKKPRRWVVERLHSWLNRSRRLLVRWEKYPQTYEAFLHLACALLCFRQCDRAQGISQAKIESLSLAA